MSHYETLTAREIADGVRSGTFSAREITEAALKSIERTEPELNAFIHVASDLALAQAAHLDAKRARGDVSGSLFGVPISIKDVFHVSGMPTSFGSPIFAGQIAEEDSLPVTRLRQAGAVLLGKTATPEFAHKSFTDGPLFGCTRNPWNRAYTSGGSSGGSAASVAAGQTRVSLGSDGGGSIRIPASTCGVFGIKGTLGTVPELAPDLFARNSYTGPIAATVDELRVTYAVLKGPDPNDPWSLAQPGPKPLPDISELRIGVALTVGNSIVEADVEEAFNEARDALALIGASIEHVTLDITRYEEPLRVHWETQLACRIAPLLERDRDRIEPSLLRKVERGLEHSAMAYASMAHRRSAMFRDIQAVFDRLDILVTPTLAAAGMPADADFTNLFVDGINAGHSRFGWHPYTWPFNLSGHPALSVPCGWTRNNLPVGLQIIGRWYFDDVLFELAARLGQVLEVEKRVWRPLRQ